MVETARVRENIELRIDTLIASILVSVPFNDSLL